MTQTLHDELLIRHLIESWAVWRDAGDCERFASTFVELVQPVSAGLDDDDALILGEAIAGQADVFVTGDTAIRRVAGIGETKILSPRGFWDYLHSQS